MKRNEVIFSKFSQNLKIIKDYLGVEFNDNVDPEAYICPLSLKIHTKEGLSNKFSDQLTIEHVPPDSLNGKALCLTNRIANSQAGHSLDLSLLKHIKLREFTEGIAPFELKAYIDDVKVRSSMNLFDQEKPSFIFDTSHFHQGIQRVENKLKERKPLKLTFNVPKDDTIYRVAFLRTAYLFAFGHIGYSLIFGLTNVINPSYDLVRKQISQPEKEIIKDIIVFKKNLPDNLLGVNIIYKPEELRSLFVVFDIVTQTAKWRYGVFLPGPDDYGFIAINQLRNQLSKGGSISFESYNLSQIELRNKVSSLEYYNHWIKYNGLYKN
jgi:hypothetical protein